MARYPADFEVPSQDVLKMVDDDSDENEYLVFRESNVKEKENLMQSLFPKKDKNVNEKPKCKNKTKRVEKGVGAVPLRRSSRGKALREINLNEPQTSTNALSVSKTPSPSKSSRSIVQSGSSSVALSSPQPSRAPLGDLNVSQNQEALPTTSASCMLRAQSLYSPEESIEQNSSSSAFASRPKLCEYSDSDDSSPNTESPQFGTSKERVMPSEREEERAIMSDETIMFNDRSLTETNQNLSDVASTINFLDHTGEASISSSEEEGRSSGHKSLPKARRRAKKKRRVIGQVITSANALPTFSQKLDSDLRNRVINRAALNRETKDHILHIAGDLYLSQREWAFLCKSLIDVYPVLSDADDPQGFKDLKYRFQNSITSERSYKLNGVHSRHKVTSAISSEPLNTNIATFLLELQRKSNNIERVRFLIKETLEARQDTNGDEALELYPHYKNGRMLLYEYSLLIKQREDVLENGAKQLLKDLGTSTENNSTEEQLCTLRAIQLQLQPNALKNKRIKPALISRDAHEVYGDVNALSIGHEAQAPFCITVVDTDQLGERVIVKALLIYKSQVISQLDGPTLPQILLLLLGSYFILQITYPTAYNSFLRLLEKQINGSFSAHTSNTRAKKEYYDFMKFTFKKT